MLSSRRSCASPGWTVRRTANLTQKMEKHRNMDKPNLNALLQRDFRVTTKESS